MVIALFLSMVALIGEASPDRTTQSIRRVEIPIEDDRVSLLELTQILLDEYGYDGHSLTFRDVRIKVSGAKGKLPFGVIHKALLGTAQIERWDSEGSSKLIIRIDEAKARVLRHRVKKRLGRAVSVLARRNVLERIYELDLADGISDDASVVLCIHGVDSSTARFHDLRSFVESRSPGVSFGAFTYANDEAIDRIARELSDRLKEQLRRAPRRRFILLGHSMGGLVARCLVESPELDVENVTTLIQIGSPNHGSRLSRLRPAADLLELLRKHGDSPRILGPFLDGLGEAGWDLWPDSPFLTELNKRPRNPRVTYHILLGDRGIFSATDLEVWKDRLLARVRRLEHGGIHGPKLETWLEDLDEVVVGKGDGAVSVARGRLDGVKEVVVPLSHGGMLRAAAPGDPQPAFEQIEAWISEARRKRPAGEKKAGSF